jgi:putative ABC transport system permease protein
MGLLNKKLLRDLFAHKTQVIAVLVIVILGTVIFTTLLIAPRSLESWLDRIFARTQYESFKVQVSAAPPSATARVQSLPGVTAVQGTIEKETTANVGGKDLTVRVISLPEAGRPSVNGLMMESGGYPAAGPQNASVAERHLARQFNLSPGDSFKLVIAGKDVPVTIAGTAASPRFLRLVADQSTVLSDPAQFGVIFMRQSDVERLFGSSEYNVIAARVSDPRAVDRTMKAAAASLAPYGVVGANTGTEEQSTRLMQMDLSNMKNVSVFFVLIFLWVSALAIYITLARIIYTEQRQIGTARALGYEKRPIVVHFLEYGLVIGITGGILGAIGGLFASGLTVTAYAGTLGLPPVQGGSRPWAMLAAGVVFAVVLAALGAVLPALRSARIMPAAAMRMDAGVSLPEPTLAASRRQRKKLLPSWLRFPLRNLSRNRKRTALSVIGLVLTLATLITVSGALGSIDYIMHKQFTQVTTWDVAAYLPRPVGPGFLKEVENIKGVVRAEPAIDSPARLQVAGDSADVSLQAYLPGTRMHGLFHAGGSTGPPGPGGMLVNSSLKRQLPLAVGETVRVDTAVGSASFKVEGFLSEPLGVSCYVDLAYVQRLTGTDAFNLVLVRTAPGADTSVSEALRRMPGVNKVETRRNTTSAVQGTINKAIRPMFSVVLIMVLVIGFAIIFTLTSITMLERRQEIATVLTLGKGPWSVARSFLIETLSVGLVVVPVGIALGWVLCWVLMYKVLSTSTTQLAPELSFAASTVVWISAAFLAVMALSVLPTARQISHIDLATAARERTT